MSDRPHIFDFEPDGLREHLEAMGLARFRAQQVLTWVYRHGVAEPAAMTNLSKTDRQRLAEALTFTRGQVVGRQLATDGTRKLLMQWSDRPSDQTECVLIPATGRGADGDARRTACISSQVGCPVGCRFCASGLGGVEDNLTRGQIVEQVWRLGREMADGGWAQAKLKQTGAGPHDVDPRSPAGITHVVFMGMGEPLANFDAVVAAIRTLTAAWGMGLSARRITVSTVGLPAQIRRLAHVDLPVTLAISLHAPNDAIRRRIIPWAQFVTIEQLLEAGRYYFEQTGREITLEYILLRGVNDRPEHARELAAIARTLRSNVNLIRYNEVRGLPFERPASDDVLLFQAILRRHHVNTHIRASRGRDIAAACGQLRHDASASGASAGHRAAGELPTSTGAAAIGQGLP